MEDQYIICPKCKTKIKLTEAFSKEIEAKLRKEYISQAKDMEKEYKEKLKQERERLQKQAKEEAKEEFSNKLRMMEEDLNEKNTKLKEAQQKELQFLKRQKELDEKEKTLDLELERKLADERQKIWKDASEKVSQEYRLQDKEKDLKLAEMRKQVEGLKRKIEEGSQQAQGEVLELELEDFLRSAFTTDIIEPVAKGIKGGDIIHKIKSHSGEYCGSIIWETKRTKSWSDSWIQKLKDDQRRVKADVAIIVSISLPKNINHFDIVDGIWVSDFQSAIGLATAIRVGLIQLAHVRDASVSKNEKKEIMYEYISGVEFKQHIESIVESFVAMKKDLDSERRAMEKIWAKREKHILRAIQSTAGMYGDLQGVIGGASLPDIKILELPSSE